MSTKKNLPLLFCLQFALMSFIACNSTENSSAAADSIAAEDSSSMQMQMAPDNSMSDTMITDSASTRPIKNPPKKN